MATASFTITYTKNGTQHTANITTGELDRNGDGQVTAREVDEAVSAAIRDYRVDGNRVFNCADSATAITGRSGVTIDSRSDVTLSNLTGHTSFTMPAVLNRSSLSAPVRTSNASDHSTWTGRPMRIRVKNADGSWGPWHEIPHSMDTNSAVSNEELARLLGTLPSNETGNMGADVQIQYQNSSGQWHRSSVHNEDLGNLYPRAGVTPPGTGDGMGWATIKYRDGNNTRTVRVQYRLDPNSPNDVNHTEATRIRDVFRNLPGYQSSWRITEIQAEGQTLDAGGFASRLSDDYVSPNNPNNPDNPDDPNNPVNGAITRNLTERLGRSRRSSKAQQRQITMILQSLLRGGNLNWRTFLSYINMSTMRREAVMNEALTYAVQSLSGLEQRQSELNTELRGLSTSDRNRYTSSMTRINNELNELSGQRTAIMNFVRDSKSVSDEGKELVKSLMAELQQEEALMRFA